MQQHRPRERGAVAVLTAIVITVLVAFLGLALDVGHLLSVRGEMQNAVDAAAMAGALQLNGTIERLDDAEAAAHAYSLQHKTDGRDAVELVDEAGVVFGMWDSQGFHERSPPWTEEKAREINAVRAAAAKSEDVWLHKFLGASSTTEVGASAVAVTGGASKAPCDTIPLVVRAPCFTGGALECGSAYVMALSPAGDDTAGLSNLIPLDYSDALKDNSSASSNSICDALQDPPSEECELEANSTFLETTNGNQISSQCDAESTSKFKEKICHWFKRWRPEEGQTKVVPVPVVRFVQDNAPTECEGQYGGTAEIVGFAMFEITGVWCEGDPGQRTGPCEPFATKQCISAIYRCGLPPPVPGGNAGAGWFGTEPVHPQLWK